MRYECYNCSKEFDETENGMCPCCHSTNFVDKAKEEKLEDWKSIVFPCCDKKIPAPLNSVAIATCSCGISHSPKDIIEYNKNKRKRIGQANRNFITQTLLVKCPDCNKFVDLGNKDFEVYNSSFAFMLNKKCPYCDILFDEKDTNESDYRVLEFKDC